MSCESRVYGPEAAVTPSPCDSVSASAPEDLPLTASSDARPRRSPRVIFASEAIKSRRGAGVDAAVTAAASEHIAAQAPIAPTTAPARVVGSMAAMAAGADDDFAVTTSEPTLFSPPSATGSTKAAATSTAAASDDGDDAPALEDSELQDFRDSLWDLLSGIRDPEFERTLEDLRVVREGHVYVSRAPNGDPCVSVRFTPTVPHCSQATTIGLCLVYALDGAVPNLKYEVHIAPGSHKLETEITRQINDKERVAAALENPRLRSVVISLCAGVRGRG